MSAATLPGGLPTARRRAPIPPVILLAIGWIALMVLVAILADLIAPTHYATQNLRARLQPPVFWGGTWAYPLGTDAIGRDMLSRLIYGIRFSIMIAVIGTLIGAVLGTVLGILAAWRRGLVEEAIMMMVDVQAALPFVILALAVLAFFGNSFVLFVIIVGLDGWERYARLARGLVLSAQESGYAVAIRTLGASPLRTYGGHILPNIASALVVQMTLNFPGTILLETSLSFLGLGIQPPLTSLGLLLGSGRALLLNAWWIAVLPGVVIFLTTLSMSLFGDWLRDRLDPTLADP
jgi:peptide/nickel transport system permease protein